MASHEPPKHPGGGLFRNPDFKRISVEVAVRRAKDEISEIFRENPL